MWTMKLQMGRFKGQKKFSMHLRNGVQAACAADLARSAILGPTPAAAAALNFPASVYTQQQVATMAALLQLKRPGMQLAGTGACSSSSSSSSSSTDGPSSGALLRSAERVKQRAALRAAADAVVAEAAAAAAATEAAARFTDAGNGPPYGMGVDWVKRDRIWRMGIFRSGGKRFTRSYSSRLHAACAADLAQLALGRAAVNILPGSIYTPEQVAAMRQLLLFERPAWSAASAGQSNLAAEAAQARMAALAQLKMAVLDAAAAVVQVAPEQAAAISQAQRLHGCCKNGPRWLVRLYVQFMACPAKQVHVFSSKDAAAAACASDLARVTVYRQSKPELNFPEHVYSSEQVAAFGALLAACYPGLRLADAAMHSSSSSSRADSSDAASSSSTRGRSSHAHASGDDSRDVEQDQQQQQQQQLQRGASSGIVVAAAEVLLAGGTLRIAEQQQSLATCGCTSTASMVLQQQQQQQQQQQRERRRAERRRAEQYEQVWPSPLQQMRGVAVPRVAGRGGSSSRRESNSQRLGSSTVLFLHSRAKAAAVAACRIGSVKCC
jgi:hypothetical protein